MNNITISPSYEEYNIAYHSIIKYVYDHWDETILFKPERIESFNLMIHNPYGRYTSEIYKLFRSLYIDIRLGINFDPVFVLDEELYSFILLGSYVRY